MGYTHYWEINQDVTESAIRRAANVIEKMIKGLKPGTLGGAMGYVETLPRIDSDAICFNGIEDFGCETFCFPRSLEYEFYKSPGSGKRYFAFCKTRGRLYDRYVTASLVIAKMLMGDDIKISSDGSIEDWDIGIEIAFPYIIHLVKDYNELTEKIKEALEEK